MNFNFNLINVVPSSHKLYFKFLSEKVESYKNKEDEAEQKIEANRFFKDFFLFNLFILFGQLTNNYKNKFYLLNNLFGANKEIVIKLFNEPFGNVHEGDVKDLTKTKYLFGKMVYITFVKSFILKHNNLFNYSTILNMNIFQRELYLLEAKNFFKIVVKSNEEESEKNYIESLNDFPVYLLEIYENILKINENFDLFDEISSLIFSVFNHIFKHMIKYNLISDEYKMKYFDLVLDTITLYNDKGCEDFGNNSYYIIKSILYTLIYKNDKVCLTRMREESFSNENMKDFVFVSNDDNNTIAKTFIFILNRLDRETNDKKKILKYDFFAHKIFELLIGNHDFYKKSSENMITLSEENLALSLEPFQVYNSLNRKMFDEIRNFSWQFQEANLNFNEFKISLKDYVQNINNILNSIKNFINEHLGTDTPDLSKKSQIYSEFCSRDSSKIKDIQKCVKYSSLMNQINNFVNIYSETKKFYLINKLKLKNFFYVDPDLLKTLLVFFYIVVDKNYENICLFMNFEAEECYNTFIDAKQSYFEYLSILSDLLFTSPGKEYKFDNFIFFCNIVSFLAQKLSFEDNISNEVNFF